MSKLKLTLFLLSACGLSANTAVAQCASSIANTDNSQSSRVVGEAWNFHAYNGSHTPANIITGGSWWSDNPAVATVDPVTGVTTAVTVGHTKIFWSKDGCMQGSKLKVLSHEVQVNPEAPTTTSSCQLSINIDNVGDVLCRGGSSGSIDASVEGALDGVNFFWSGERIGPNITGLIAGSYTLTVSKDGCIGDSKVVTVGEPAAALSASAALGTAILCHGGSTTVLVAGSGGTGTYTGVGTFTVGANADGYSYTVTDANGCVANTPNTGAVTEPPALSATAALNAPIACNGGSTTLTVAATGGTGAYSGTGTYTVAASNTGYTYPVSDGNGCSTVTSSGTVTEPSKVQISWAGIVRPCTISGTCYSHTVLYGYDEFMNLSITGGTYGSSSSLVTVGVSAMQPTYTVRLNDANGCTSNTLVALGENVTCGQNGNLTKTVMCRNKKNLCVDDNAVATQLATGAQLGACGSSWAAKQGQPVSQSAVISLYPNPANGSFAMEIPAPAHDLYITIMDMNGRVVEARSVAASGYDQHLDISLSNVSKGIYMVQAIGGDLNFRTKLVIE